MPAAEVAARVRQSLESVKVSDLENVQLIEVLRMAQQLTDTMQMFFGSLDKSIHAPTPHRDRWQAGTHRRSARHAAQRKRALLEKCRR